MPVQADRYLQHHREMVDACLSEMQDEMPPGEVIALAQVHATMALVALLEHLVVELRNLREPTAPPLVPIEGDRPSPDVLGAYLRAGWTVDEAGRWRPPGEDGKE